MECCVCYENKVDESGFNCTICKAGKVCKTCVLRIIEYENEFRCPLCRKIELIIETPSVDIEEIEEKHICIVDVPKCFASFCWTIVIGVMLQSIFDLYSQLFLVNVVYVFSFGLVAMLVLHWAIIVSAAGEHRTVCLPYSCCFLLEN